RRRRRIYLSRDDMRAATFAVTPPARVRQLPPGGQRRVQDAAPFRHIKRHGQPGCSGGATHQATSASRRTVSIMAVASAQALPAMSNAAPWPTLANNRGEPATT